MNNLVPAGLGAVGGYVFAQMPPYHDRSKGKASVLVLSCIDPRFTHDTAWFLTHNQELHADYDLICLAGASIGFFHSECWRSMVIEHIDLAIKLHGISEVWCINHLDCGMAKAVFNVKDDTEKIHIDSIKDFKKELGITHPNLKFRGYLIDINGHISLKVSE
jgi:carbonic anhydrase